MGQFYYEVGVGFQDATMADAWVRWIQDGHLAEVVACGALNGRLVAMDEPLSFVVQYDFENRAAFERYLADHAPRLRAEGLKRFPAEHVKYSRRTGQIL